jgi:peptide chain release factor 2
MQEYQELEKDINKAYKQLQIERLISANKDLSEQMQTADFWSDNERATSITRQHSSNQIRIDLWTNLKKDAGDLVSLASLQDSSLSSELSATYKNLLANYNKAKTELQFSGPYDSSDVILSIFAGAGGTDAQDWAQMLLRMYTRYAESAGLEFNTIDISSGEEAGIKSATVEISGGSFLYGKLKSENGVHRLVRLSPFNADSLRQTSFARVEIIPKIDSPDKVEIDEKDIKVDVYRSGGKGGQSVNTTDSAVRVTHIPTNIVVAIQNERSQLQNRETAMTILRSKLAQLQLEQHKSKVSELKGPNEQASWGNQIRNYVMHPYTMVKDTRTKAETTDLQAVLDGSIDQFIKAYLES